MLTSAAASAALIVRCANCQTEFSLDDRQVGPEGASLRCSVCSYVFRVAPKRGGTPTWQIRTIDDMQFFAPDLKTLRAWITEGRLHPDDQVSRTGKHWLRLGDMPEFSNAFAGFGGLPDVFVPIESPALDSLGPPPSFAGSASSVGAPTLTQPPLPTGGIHLEAVSEATVRKRVAARGLPSTMATEPVLDGRRATRAPPGPSQPSQVPTVQAPVSGEMRDGSGPPPSIEAFGTTPAEPAVPRAEPTRPSRPISVAVADEMSGVVTGPRAGVESSGQRRAASMLEAVTSRVQPVVRPAEPRHLPTTAAAPNLPFSRPIDFTPGSPASSAAATTAGVRPPDLADGPPPRTRSRPPGELDAIADRKPRRGWPLVAGLGALAGIAVVFGIPSVRDRVFGVAGGVVGSALDASEDAGARKALASLDAAALEQSEAALRKRGDAASRARAAEIVATRAILTAIEAAIAGDPPSPPSADLEAAASDARADPRAAVLVVLARGGLADATAADRETQLIAAAAPLWRDATAGVPTGVIGGLERIGDRSGLGSIVLSLAYWRGGDERRAREVAAAQLERAPGQSTATALIAALGPVAVGGDEVPTSPSGESASESAADPGTAGAAADAPPSADGGTGEVGEIIALADDGGESGAADPDGGSAISEPRLSVDGLISRGCSKVESGDAAGGVKLLEKAHDKRPADVDAMLCLGQGYAKLGSHGTALRYFESTLDRSPKFVAALRGAARSSVRLGKTSKAVGFYERLLELDPGNADAKAYVAEHGAGAEPSTPSPSPSPDPGPDPAPDPAPAEPETPAP